MAVGWEMGSALLGGRCTVHSCRVRGSPRSLNLYADERRLVNSSSSSAVVAVTVKSSILMATIVAAIGMILWKRNVSASDL